MSSERSLSSSSSRAHSMKHTPLWTPFFSPLQPCLVWPFFSFLEGFFVKGHCTTHTGCVVDLPLLLWLSPLHPLLSRKTNFAFSFSTFVILLLGLAPGLLAAKSNLSTRFKGQCFNILSPEKRVSNRSRRA